MTPERNLSTGCISQQTYASFYKILTIIGIVGGIGTLFRFPSVCIRGGGAPFLYAYLICTILITYPLNIFELAIGQMTQKGILTGYSSGIAYATVVRSFLMAIDFNVTGAWWLYFFFASFQTTLDWSTQYHSTKFPGDYFSNVITKKGESINDMDSISLTSLGLLFLVWFFTFCVIYFRIRRNHYCVYFTATLPYLVLIMMALKLLYQNGFSDGMYYLFVPRNFSSLFQLPIWLSACQQAFIAHALGWGTMVTYGSNSGRNYPCMTDVKVITISIVLISVLSGIVLMGGAGVMAHQYNTTIEILVSIFDGYRAANFSMIFFPYIAGFFPKIINAITFFIFTMITIDTQFVQVEACIGILHPLKIVSQSGFTLRTTLTICLLFFVVSIPFATPASFYLHNLIGDFVTGANLFINVLCELIVCSHTLTLINIYNYIKYQVKQRIPFMIYVSWKYFHILILILFSVMMMRNVFFVRDNSKIVCGRLGDGANEIYLISGQCRENTKWSIYYIGYLSSLATMFPIVLISLQYLIRRTFDKCTSYHNNKKVIQTWQLEQSTQSLSNQQLIASVDANIGDAVIYGCDIENHESLVEKDSTSQELCAHSDNITHGLLDHPANCIVSNETNDEITVFIHNEKKSPLAAATKHEILSDCQPISQPAKNPEVSRKLKGSTEIDISVNCETSHVESIHGRACTTKKPDEAAKHVQFKKGHFNHEKIAKGSLSCFCNSPGLKSLPNKYKSDIDMNIPTLYGNKNYIEKK